MSERDIRNVKPPHFVIDCETIIIIIIEEKPIDVEFIFPKHPRGIK